MVKGVPSMSETDGSEYVPESVPETVPSDASLREKKIGNMENPCPIPPEHVRSYSECCDKYAKGEISDLDVIGEVISSLRKLRTEGK